MISHQSKSTHARQVTSHIDLVAYKRASRKQWSDHDNGYASSRVPEKKVKCQPSVNTLVQKGAQQLKLTKV